MPQISVLKWAHSLRYLWNLVNWVDYSVKDLTNKLTKNLKDSQRASLFFLLSVMVQLFTAVVSWYILVFLIVKSWTQCIKLRFHEEKRIKIPTHDVPFTYFPTHNNVEIYQLPALCHKTTLRVCLFNHTRFI